MTGGDVQGTFVWHELMGADADAVESFYERLLGWKAHPWERDPSYTVWAKSQEPVAGVTRRAADTRETGSAPLWLAYVAVQDVQATAETSERLGGRIVKPTSSLPDGGQYAVLADPQSALIGICSASDTGSARSDFPWHQLETGDHSAAFQFYRELFGWEELGVYDMGAMGPYVLFGRDGRQFGGMFNRPPGATSAPHWLLFVDVPSAVSAAQAAALAGGRVTNGPHQVPGGSWIVQLTDPQGAAIAVHQGQAAAVEPQPKRRSGADGLPPSAKAPSVKVKPAVRSKPRVVKKSAAAGKRRTAGPRKRRAVKKTAAKRRVAKKAVAKRSTARKSSAKRRAARGRVMKRGAARSGRRASRKAPKKATGRATSGARRKSTVRRAVRRTVRRKVARRRRR